MIECATLDEAQAVSGVMHVRASAGKWIAYVAGDQLPSDVDPRDEKVAAVDAEWSGRKDAGFHYLGKLIDSDVLSRENIANAAMAALTAKALGVPFSLAPAQGWKCADDSYLDLDADGVLGMHATMMQAGLALFAHAQVLKTAIAAAADAASFDVTSGWPTV